MLLNVSYKDRKKKEKIEKEVGRPFSLMQRFKLGGIGSGKLYINSSSIQIHNLLILDSYLNTCSIELRPDGIILTFRSLLETYALIIPYYKLKIYKGQARQYSIYRDNYYVKIKADQKRIHNFMKKLRDQKIDHWSSQ